MNTSIKLDEISDKYNKAYHGTIKMKPTDVTLDTYINYGIKHNDKDPKFRELMTMWEYQSTNIFFQKGTRQNDLRKPLW